MVGRRGGAPTCAEVDFPLGRDEEIHDREDLLLLVVEIDKVPEFTPVAVILNAKVEGLGGLVGDGCRRAEGEATR